MDRLPLADHTQLYRAIGLELSQTMGGSSGVLLAIFFAAAGDAASSGHDHAPTRSQAGLARLQEIGGAELGDRTMVDALQPALEALRATGFRGPPRLRARAPTAPPRSSAQGPGAPSYLSAEQIRGHVDPGAEAVARLFERLCDAGPVP